MHCAIGTCHAAGQHSIGIDTIRLGAAELHWVIRLPGCAGVPERFEGMPLTDVLLVNIKLLMLSELKLITQKGTEGRRRLSDAFTEPARLVSSTRRTAVL